jgi:hypothetical protein
LLPFVDCETRRSSAFDLDRNGPSPASGVRWKDGSCRERGQPPDGFRKGLRPGVSLSRFRASDL